MGEIIAPRDVSNGGQTILAGGTYKSEPIKMLRVDGFFSIQPFNTGSGVLKIEYQTANTINKPKETEWDNAVEIIAIALKNVVYPYTPSVHSWQRLLFTETDSTDPVVISAAMLVIQ